MRIGSATSSTCVGPATVNGVTVIAVISCSKTATTTIVTGVPTPISAVPNVITTLKIGTNCIDGTKVCISHLYMLKCNLNINESRQAQRSVCCRL